MILRVRGRKTKARASAPAPTPAPASASWTQDGTFDNADKNYGPDSYLKQCLLHFCSFSGSV